MRNIAPPFVVSLYSFRNATENKLLYFFNENKSRTGSFIFCKFALFEYEIHIHSHYGNSVSNAKSTLWENKHLEDGMFVRTRSGEHYKLYCIKPTS